MTTLTVAIVGLGRMGGPICRHVLGAGHDVRVFDVDDIAIDAQVAMGAIRCTSAADAGRGAAVACIVVFDDAQVVDVITGPEGLLSTLPPGAVVAVHTTVTLGTIRTLANAAEARGVALVDAGISGGEDGAQKGTLLVLCGGPSEALETARPILEAFSKEIVHAGPLGTGMALKLARNASGYLMMTAVHEAMLLATRAGVELGLLSHVISETGVFSQAMAPFALGGPDPLPEDDTGMRPAMEHLARLAEKDLEHTLGLAADLGVDLPVTAATLHAFPGVARLTKARPRT